MKHGNVQGRILPKSDLILFTDVEDYPSSLSCRPGAFFLKGFGFLVIDRAELNYIKN